MQPFLQKKLFPAIRAFTIIELLVVIAIVAILAGLLLPALNKVMKKAKEIQCVAQLKQWAVASELYNSDYADFYAPSRDVNYNITVDYLEPYTHSKNNKKRENIRYCPAEKTPGEGGWGTAYTANLHLFAVADRSDWFASTEKWTRTAWGKTTRPLDNIVEKPTYNNMSVSPSTRMMMIEGTNGVLSAWTSLRFRHSGAINLAYLDGHAATVKAPPGSLFDTTGQPISGQSWTSNGANLFPWSLAY